MFERCIVVALLVVTASPLSALEPEKSKDAENVFLTELRTVFEGSFEAWVTSLARAEHCGAGRVVGSEIEEVIEAAADAFFPGLLNIRRRMAYQKELTGRLKFAELKGMQKAMSGNCLFAERLANYSRLPVDQAISAALN